MCIRDSLETEPIGRLIRRYSIPTALTLMVNYLYNIVDQIFVGQGVGVTGMAATNVAFPLTIVTIALALMIGDGCAANKMCIRDRCYTGKKSAIPTPGSRPKGGCPMRAFAYLSQGQAGWVEKAPPQALSLIHI